MYDFHTHFVPEQVMTWIKENKNLINADWEKRHPLKEDFLVINGKWAFELKKQFIDSELFLQEQDNAGVSHSVVSPIPQLFLYDFPTEITYELSTIYNEAMIQWSKMNPSKISGFATVPLNKPEHAAKELRRIVQAGLKGAIIGPGTSDCILTDDSFLPFWETANETGAIIFIHPLLCEDPRLKKRMMPNLIGAPWETTICATDLLLSGLLDKFRDVKLLLAHGGGYLPYQIGRLNKGYEVWEKVSTPLSKKPEDYLRRFWFDSVVWNPDGLKFLEDTVGNDRIVPGSDFPFDLCEWPPQLSSQSGVETILENKPSLKR